MRSQAASTRRENSNARSQMIDLDTKLETLNFQARRIPSKVTQNGKTRPGDRADSARHHGRRSAFSS